MSKIGFIFLSNNQLPIKTPCPDRIFLTCLTFFHFFNKHLGRSGITLLERTTKRYSYKLLKETITNEFNINMKYIIDIITLPKKTKNTTLYLVLLDNNITSLKTKNEKYIINNNNLLVQYKIPPLNDEYDLFTLISNFHRNNSGMDYSKMSKINIYDSEELKFSIFLKDIVNALVGVINLKV